MEFTANNFLMEVERLHFDGMTYLEAIANYCDVHGVDYDTAARVIRRSPIAAKLEAECMDLRLLPSGAKLPV